MRFTEYNDQKNCPTRSSLQHHPTNKKQSLVSLFLSTRASERKASTTTMATVHKKWTKPCTKLDSNVMDDAHKPRTTTPSIPIPINADEHRQMADELARIQHVEQHMAYREYAMYSLIMEERARRRVERKNEPQRDQQKADFTPRSVLMSECIPTSVILHEALQQQVDRQPREIDNCSREEGIFEMDTIKTTEPSVPSLYNSCSPDSTMLKEFYF